MPRAWFDARRGLLPLLVFAAGCGQDPAAAGPADIPLLQEQLVRQFFEAYQARDATRPQATLHPDFEFYGAVETNHFVR